MLQKTKFGNLWNWIEIQKKQNDHKERDKG